jgi:hypothetical protein
MRVPLLGLETWPRAHARVLDRKPRPQHGQVGPPTDWPWRVTCARCNIRPREEGPRDEMVPGQRVCRVWQFDLPMNGAQRAGQEATELKGRLHLWNTALLEVRVLLADACRAREARNVQPFPVGEITEASRGAHPFGTWIDLDQVFHSYRLLAAVFFCQMFKQGKAAAGLAAANRAQAIVAERDSIVATAFPIASDLERFGRLLHELEIARDEVIAHAQGDAFGITHGDTIVLSDAHSESLRKVDLGFWRDATRALQDEVQRRMKELSADSATIRG